MKSKIKDFFSRKKFGHGNAHYLGSADGQPRTASPSGRPHGAAASRLTQEAPQRPERRARTSGPQAERRLGTAHPVPDTRPGSQPTPEDTSQRQQAAPPADQKPTTPAAAAGPLNDEVSEALHIGIGFLISEERNTNSGQVLKKILNNVLSNPSEQKYRRLRLDNPKIMESIVAVNGAVDILRACGFEDGKDRFLVLPDSTDLQATKEAVKLLEQHFPTSPPAHQLAPTGDEQQGGTAQSTTATRAEPSPTTWPRNTKLLLPRPTETEVPDWFFQRTGAEIKAQYLAAKKAREDSEILMTKAYRERLAAGKRNAKNPTHAVIRVRLPEGVLLQGEFGKAEPLTSIREWLADQIRDPARDFELYLPSRGALPVQGDVRQADLMPTALLNVRFEDRGSVGQSAPTVKDEVLRLAEMDW